MSIAEARFLPATIPVSSPRKPPAARYSWPRYHCTWLWDSLTVLCDGTVTCGLDDPFGTRSYGNAATTPIAEIFNSPKVAELRKRLLSGARCETCYLYTPIAEDSLEGLPAIPPTPRRLVIESTIRCNIRCANTICDLNNDRDFHVRKEQFLSFELFCRVIDEAGPHLEELFFFNYGEPFLNPRAVDMLAHARQRYPRLKIFTSTNGILLSRGDAARRIVEEGLTDWMNFSIAGCDEESYSIYHRGEHFGRAIGGLRRIVEEKQRLGRALPIVRWRYLLFNWNDTDDHLARTRALAREIGVDELTFFLCSAPLEGRSFRRAPGQPGFAAIADAVEYEVHYKHDRYADAGLYRPEHDANLGAFCWTGRKARVDLIAENGIAALDLARIGLPPQAFGRVKVTAPWETRVANVGQGAWETNRFELPADYSGRNVAIEIEVELPFIPFKHGINDDIRELGVMVGLSTVCSPA